MKTPAYTSWPPASLAGTAAVALSLALCSTASQADEVLFEWTATCTVACSLLTLSDGDQVSGFIAIDAAAVTPLGSVQLADISSWKFVLGNVVLTPGTHTMNANLDLSVSTDSSSLSVNLIEVDAGGFGGPNFFQQPDGVWNAQPIGVGFVLGIGSTYTRLHLDTDDDGIDDQTDNCLLAPNPTQLDTNGDGYGNVCDADLNNDGVINFLDLGLMKAVFFTDNADADLDGDGVSFSDLAIMKARFFGAPGPSAIAP